MIYNASGQVIASNDDSFQDTDSSIIDLTLPTTGTYYVMVTSSPDSTALGQPLTGSYELFMYTFAAGTTATNPPTGDTMYAGSGDDTIVAGSADDTIEAQPQDTVVYGSGAVNLLTAVPTLNVSAGINQTVDEGTSVSLTGSFLAPSGDTSILDWHVVASSGQQIADGTGSSFTFTPGNAGTYTVTFTVIDPNVGWDSGEVVITSDDLPPVLTGSVASQSAYAGVKTPIDLGTLAVKGVGPFTETVQWGDGQTSTDSPSSSGPLSLDHAYATAGTYTIDETISEYYGGSTSTEFDVTVTVASTSTALQSSAPSAVYGQSVTFTAMVTGPGNATGPVSFYAGPVNTADLIGTGTLGVVGGQDVATFRTTAMPVSGSPYSITAVYGGDPDNVGSTSNVIEQSIDRDSTTTTASSSALTSNLGQTLTLTASVTANAPGSGTPTGSVDFYDTTTQTDLGSVPLVSGAAALPIATLPLGTQTITETYSGDTDFVPSIGTVSEVIAVPLDILNISSVSPTHTAVFDHRRHLQRANRHQQPEPGRLDAHRRRRGQPDQRGRLAHPGLGRHLRDRRPRRTDHRPGQVHAHRQCRRPRGPEWDRRYRLALDLVADGHHGAHQPRRQRAGHQPDHRYV